MAKTRDQKEQLYEKYTEAFKNAKAIFIVDSSNLSTEQITDIKIKLYELGAKFMVLKNTVFSKAHKDSELKHIDWQEISGPSGAFFVGSEGDPSAVTKVIKEFQNNFELLKAKFGIMDGVPLSQEQIKTIADLPTKDELLAQTVYVIAGPVRNLMGVMNGAVRDFIQILNAIKEEKTK